MFSILGVYVHIVTMCVYNLYILMNLHICFAFRTSGINGQFIVYEARYREFSICTSPWPCQLVRHLWHLYERCMFPPRSFCWKSSQCSVSILNFWKKSHTVWKMSMSSCLGQGFSALEQVHHDTDLSYRTSNKLHEAILVISKVLPNHDNRNNIRHKL